MAHSKTPDTLELNFEDVFEYQPGGSKTLAHAGKNNRTYTKIEESLLTKERLEKDLENYRRDLCLQANLEASKACLSLIEEKITALEGINKENEKSSQRCGQEISCIDHKLTANESRLTNESPTRSDKLLLSITEKSPLINNLLNLFGIKKHLDAKSKINNIEQIKALEDDLKEIKLAKLNCEQIIRSETTENLKEIKNLKLLKGNIADRISKTEKITNQISFLENEIDAIRRSQATENSCHEIKHTTPKLSRSNHTIFDGTTIENTMSISIIPTSCRYKY